MSSLQINHQPLPGMGTQHTGPCGALTQLQENESVGLATWLREERGLTTSGPSQIPQRGRRELTHECGALNCMCLHTPSPPHTKIKTFRN